MNKILRNLADIYYGQSPNRIRLENSEYPIFGTGGQVGYAVRPLFEGPAIIVGRKGTLGNPIFTPTGFWAIDTTYAVKPKVGIDAKWLYYHLLNFDLTKLNEATGVPSINREYLYQVNINYCTLDEQRKIAEILSTVDNSIEQTEALIQKYQRIKRGLMQDLLTRGMDEKGNIRNFDRHEFKQTPLGLFPKGWKITTLESVSEKIADRDHTTPSYVENGIIIVSPKDFNEIDEINFETCNRIPLNEHLQNRKKTDIQPNDIVFTRIGAGLGKACLVSRNMPEFSILHSMALIRPNMKLTDPMFFLYLLRSSFIQKQIKNGIQSIGVPDLGLDKIKQLFVFLPEVEEQKKIASILYDNDNNIRTNLIEQKKLLNIKQGLMQDLLTGKVRVNALLEN